MFKVTYKTIAESVNFFKWFKSEEDAKLFANSVNDRFVKMEKL